MKTLLRMPSVGGARKTFFMVSEQVNLNHERPPYGKIEKSTKSLHPNERTDPGYTYCYVSNVVS